MFWGIGKKRDIETERAREREAFLRRLREVLEPHSAAFASAPKLCESFSGGVTRGQANSGRE